jgi:hypothetical protein
VGWCGCLDQLNLGDDKMKMEYKVYDKNNKFLAGYGIGWSLKDIFNGITNSHYVVLVSVPGNEIVFEKEELKKIK